MGRRFVDMRTIQRRMAGKDARVARLLAKQKEHDAMTSLVTTPKELPSPDVISRVLLGGDLSQLDAKQKVSYYGAMCDSLGLNPLTKPFEFLRLSGREVLYATRNATDQLRNLYGISVTITAREVIEDCYVVTARASMPNGRHDESTGAVPIANLKGEFRANAMLKCETKAKRRVTLSLVGLSTLDESEVESIPGAQPVAFPDVSPGREALEAGSTDRAAVNPDRGSAPANLNANIPASWRPFIQGEAMTGAIVNIATESKDGRKAGQPHTYVKTVITLENGVEFYKIDDPTLTAQARAHVDAGERVTITARDTTRGHEIQSLAVANDAAF